MNVFPYFLMGEEHAAAAIVEDIRGSLGEMSPFDQAGDADKLIKTAGGGLHPFHIPDLPAQDQLRLREVGREKRGFSF